MAFGGGVFVRQAHRGQDRILCRAQAGAAQGSLVDGGRAADAGVDGSLALAPPGEEDPGRAEQRDPSDRQGADQHEEARGRPNPGSKRVPALLGEAAALRWAPSLLSAGFGRDERAGAVPLRTGPAGAAASWIGLVAGCEGAAAVLALAGAGVALTAGTGVAAGCGAGDEDWPAACSCRRRRQTTGCCRHGWAAAPSRRPR